MIQGLGFAPPVVSDEQKRAAQMASLSGSTAASRIDPTAQPQPSVTPPSVGQTVAPQQPAPQQPVTPSPAVAPMARAAAAGPAAAAQQLALPPAQAPGATPQAPPGKKGPVDWNDPGQVMRAIGHVLISVQAGMEGKELPPLDLQGEDEQRQKLEMAKTEFMFNAVARGYEISRFAPPEKRDQLLQVFADQVKRVAPDFDLIKTINLATQDTSHFDNAAPDMAMLSPDSKRRVMAEVQRRGGRPEDVVDVLKDRQFMDPILSAEDQQNAPLLGSKIKTIREAMAQGGISPDAMSNMDWDAFAAANDQLPENVRLTPSELGTLRRNPRYQQMLGIGGQDRRQPTFDETTQGSDQAPPPTQAQPRVPPAPRPSQAPRPAATTAGASPARPSPRVSSPGAGPKPKPPKSHARTQEADEDAALADQIGGTIGQPAKPTAKPASPSLNTGRNTHMFEPPRQPRARQYEVPRDMELPGIGKVKKGTRVIYENGKYRLATAAHR